MQLYWVCPSATSPSHFGSGHVGRALAKLASELVLRSHLYDDLQENRDKAYAEGLEVVEDMSPTEIRTLANIFELYFHRPASTLSTSGFRGSSQDAATLAGVIGSERKQSNSSNGLSQGLL